MCLFSQNTAALAPLRSHSTPVKDQFNELHAVELVEIGSLERRKAP